MSLDTATVLEAGDTWKQLAALVPTIRAYLVPRRSGSTTRTPPASRPPLDLAASDLLRELDDAATFYVRVLMDETPDVKTCPRTLEERLTLTGVRVGHFSAEDDRSWLDYADMAHELHRRAVGLITKPAPPKFMGPCLAVCGGDLWLRPGRVAATCDTCGSDADLGAVREQLARALESRLMTRSEIRPALRIIGHRTTPDQVRQWIHRGRLQPALVEPEMFRFADALNLANPHGERASA